MCLLRKSQAYNEADQHIGYDIIFIVKNLHLDDIQPVNVPSSRHMESFIDVKVLLDVCSSFKIAQCYPVSEQIYDM